MPAPASSGPTIARLVVSVADSGRSLVLYRDVLGLTVTRETPELTFLSTADGIEVMLHQRPATPSDTAVALGFGVDDVAMTAGQWADRGGVIVDPPAVQPWGETMAVIRDADGHLVCLYGRA